VKILVLGSTGSIGTNVCTCIRRYPRRFELVGLGVHRNIDKLAAQVDEFKPGAVYIGDEEAARRAAALFPPGVRLYTGPRGLVDIVNESDFDLLVNAIVGAAGFKPTVAALKRRARVALANKESLVIGGEYITGLLARGLGELIPIDSEHSAIYQCLLGEDPKTIESIILTASGGPFRDLPPADFPNVTPEQALKHPTWNMGAKITIDAATLINKGFEVIEAHHLFALPYERLRVWIHPQSIVHSMVEFHDGAVIAQMGVPSMELPIQFALSFPQRLPLPGARLDLPRLRTLSFFEPDFDRFPCLRLCIEVGKTGGTAPVVLNAANEVAVQLFLNKKIGFHQKKADSAEIIENTDAETRKEIAAQFK
jgi:1-deoxy-D-xylulose-5-phosphate reductoisomerase